MTTFIKTVFILNLFFAEANSFIPKFLALFIRLKVRTPPYLAKALSLGLQLTASMIGRVYPPNIFYCLFRYLRYPLSYLMIFLHLVFSLLPNITPIYQIVLNYIIVINLFLIKE